MSEFERARERAERKLAKRGVDVFSKADLPTQEQMDEAISVIAPKAPKKRSNEIAVQVWIDGNEYGFTFKTNITGTFLGTQQNAKGMQAIILEALRAKFGAVEQV